MITESKQSQLQNSAYQIWGWLGFGHPEIEDGHAASLQCRPGADAIHDTALLVHHLIYYSDFTVSYGTISVPVTGKTLGVVLGVGRQSRV